MTSYFDEYPELRGIESADAFSVARMMVEKLTQLRREQMAWLIDNKFAVVDGFEDGDGEPLYRLPRGISLEPRNLFAREGAVLDRAFSARPGDDSTRLRLAAAVLVAQYRVTFFGQRKALGLTKRFAA
jgi:hypothetical protein